MLNDKVNEFKRRAVLIIFPVLLWLPAKDVYFIGDDFTLLTEQLIRPFSLFTVSAQFIMPTFKLFLALGGKLFGANPAGYHCLILIFHIVNILLFYELLKRFDSSPMTALASALLWGTLPQYAESIFWVTGSVHTITLTFVLLAIMFFIKWVRTGSVVSCLFTIIFFMTAFYCKETAVVFLFFVAGYLYKNKAPIKKFSARLLPFVAVFAVMMIVNWLIRAGLGLNIKAYYSTNISVYLKNIVYYTLYNLFGIQFFPNIITSLIIIFILGLSAYFIRRTPQSIYFLLYFLSLIPFVIVGKAPQRYSYISSMWLFPLAVTALRDFFVQKKDSILKYAVIILGLLFIFVSLVRLRIEYFDYKGFGDMHRNIVEKTARYMLKNGIDKNKVYIFINDRTGYTPILINRNMRGFDKLWGLRDRGVGDLIYLDDLFNFCIYGLKTTYLHDKDTVFKQTSNISALTAIRTGNYKLLEYNASLGFLQATFKEEGLAIIMNRKRLPPVLIPYKAESKNEFKREI